MAKEESCELKATDSHAQEEMLLKHLASTEAFVRSPYEAHDAAQTLSELLVAAKQEGA